MCLQNLGRDVISPVLQVSHLRSMGITLHLWVLPCVVRGSYVTEAPRHIASTRAPIPDVPAIYLVEPTPANLQAITNDLKKGLYGSAYVNFLSSIPRPLLEDFAAQTAASDTSEQIAQIYDQYLNFIVTEPDLFSLGMQEEHTYWALNSAKTSDEELDRVIDRIVSGLFSVVVTMGVIPIVSDVEVDTSSSNLSTLQCANATYQDTLPKRSCRRDDCDQTRPQAPRPHSQL